jgi:hypothetical protein
MQLSFLLTGPGHHIRLGRDRREDPERGPGAIRSGHLGTAGRNRPLLLYRGSIGVTPPLTSGPDFENVALIQLIFLVVYSVSHLSVGLFL